MRWNDQNKTRLMQREQIRFRKQTNKITNKSKQSPCRIMRYMLKVLQLYIKQDVHPVDFMCGSRSVRALKNAWISVDTITHNFNFIQAAFYHMHVL